MLLVHNWSRDDTKSTVHKILSQGPWDPEQDGSFSAFTMLLFVSLVHIYLFIIYNSPNVI